MNVADTVKAEKRGKLDFRVDKAGIIHAGIGRKSMGADKLKENFQTFLGAVQKAKPASSKGVYLKGITISSTMGPGVKVDLTEAQAEA
jgi:large subunit ribosomal protein L1